MGVYERVMGLGSWDIQLRGNTPKTVRDTIATPFAHLVVLPSRVRIVGGTPAVGDTAALAGALYTGVVLQPGPQLNLSGVGLAWWLGDEGGQGDVLTTAISGTAATFQTWVGALVPAALTAGAIELAGGSHTGSYQWISRRDALDAVCDFFGREWRITPALALDAGATSNLYGLPTLTTVPVAVAGGGRGLARFGVRGIPRWSRDWANYGSSLVLLGRAGKSTAGGASSYRDGRGNLVTRTKVVEDTAVDPTAQATTATNLLAEIQQPQQEITVTADDYAITGRVTLGGYILVYDEILGINDPATQIQWQGRTIWPATQRVLGARWPVEAGMGVYYRAHNGVSAVWTDLSPYVEWESGSAILEVGWSPRPLLGRFADVDERTRRLQQATYDEYSAGWYGSVTNPTAGASTSVGSFRREGTRLSLTGVLTIGAGFAAGSGDYSFDLPSGVTADSGREQNGTGRVTLSGGATYACVCLVLASGARVYLQRTDTNGIVGSGNPGGWAVGDKIYWNIQLEVAP